MPVCPRCHDTYVDGVATCAECDLELLADDAPLPPRVDRLLGTFDPVVADHLTVLLNHRRIPHRLVDSDGLTEVIVERDSADPLRAELVASWGQVLASLEHEERTALPSAPLRGWVDAPDDAWVDRDGRLRAAADDDTEAIRDAQRTWGPGLVVGGALMLLYGWYGGGGEPVLVLGGLAVVVGIFLPR